jgi:hypothetical protein
MMSGKTVFHAATFHLLYIILKENQNEKKYLFIAHDTRAPGNSENCAIAVFSPFIFNCPTHMANV